MPEVELVPVTEAEFPEFRERALRMYVSQLTQAGMGRAEELADFAEQDFNRYLPDGTKTPDHLLYWVGSGGVRVGMLWVGIRREPPRPRTYVYAVDILEAHQRRGFGEAAMRAVETLTWEHGFDSVGLNVFSYNAPAIRLYEKLGYSATAQQMVKNLGPAPE